MLWECTYLCLTVFVPDFYLFDCLSFSFLFICLFSLKYWIKDHALSVSEGCLVYMCECLLRCIYNVLLMMQNEPFCQMHIIPERKSTVTWMMTELHFFNILMQIEISFLSHFCLENTLVCCTWSTQWMVGSCCLLGSMSCWVHRHVTVAPPF